jgi:hypothetical protein
MPAEIVFDHQSSYVTDPVNPCAGEDFTVTWQEKNIGDTDSAAYQDIFDLDDQGNGDSKSVDCDPVAAGASVQRSLTFNLPSGTYQMSLVINGVGPLALGDVIVDDCTQSTDGN